MHSLCFLLIAIGVGAVLGAIAIGVAVKFVLKRDWGS
jgi:hypothetical protein